MDNLTTAELIDIINKTDSYSALCEYKYRIKFQTETWFKNINNLNQEIIKMPDGMLVTSSPIDKFNIINTHISIAQEKLSERYLKDVIAVCYKVLQDEQTFFDISNMSEVDILCTHINYCLSMSGYCNKHLNYGVLDEVANQYLTMADTATVHLAKIIFDDFHTDINMTSDVGIKSLVATLKDYFCDLSQWLNDKYYCMLVKELMSIIRNKYKTEIELNVHSEQQTLDDFEKLSLITNKLKSVLPFMSDDNNTQKHTDISDYRQKLIDAFSSKKKLLELIVDEHMQAKEAINSCNDDMYKYHADTRDWLTHIYLGKKVEKTNSL